jgi:hypothetical protein
VHAVALALHLDDLGVGEEAIEDGGGAWDVAEEDAPVLGGSVGGDECRAASCRRTKTSRRSSAALGPSRFMPKSSMTRRSILVRRVTSCFLC